MIVYRQLNDPPQKVLRYSLYPRILVRVKLIHQIVDSFDHVLRRRLGEVITIRAIGWAVWFGGQTTRLGVQVPEAAVAL